MITFDFEKQVLPTLHYWAHYYHKIYPWLEHEELMNVGYLGGWKKLKDESYLAGRIRWDMQHYIKVQAKGHKRRSIRDRKYYDDIMKERAYRQRCLSKDELIQDLDVIILKAMLDKREKHILYLTFYKGLEQRKIGEELYLSATRIGQLQIGIMNALKQAARELGVLL